MFGDSPCRYVTFSLTPALVSAIARRPPARATNRPHECSAAHKKLDEHSARTIQVVKPRAVNEHSFSFHQCPQCTPAPSIAPTRIGTFRSERASLAGLARALRVALPPRFQPLRSFFGPSARACPLDLASSPAPLSLADASRGPRTARTRVDFVTHVALHHLDARTRGPAGPATNAMQSAEIADETGFSETAWVSRHWRLSAMPTRGPARRLALGRRQSYALTRPRRPAPR